MALSVQGSLTVFGAYDDIIKLREGLLEYRSLEDYFDWRIYYDSFIPEPDEDGDSEKEIEIEIEFRAMVPITLLNLSKDYPECNYNFSFQYEGCLGDWYELNNFLAIPEIANHQDKDKVNPDFALEGNISWGSDEYVYETLSLFDWDDEYLDEILGINQKIPLSDLKKDYKLSWFMLPIDY